VRNPIVSVVIPTHNCLAFLPHCLAGIGANDDINIVVVVDRSNDGSREWLAQAAKQDPRIRPFSVEFGNAGAARNFGVRQCESELIAFLDADDIWLPRKLFRQVEFHLRNPDIVLSFTNYRHRTLSGELRSSILEYLPNFHSFIPNQATFADFERIEQPLPAIYAANVIGTSTVLLNREQFLLADGFDERLAVAEDWDLWLRLAGQGPFAYSPKIMSHYLLRPDSTSRHWPNRLKGLREVVSRFEETVAAQSPRVVHHAKARLMVAEAEAARAQQKLLSAWALHAKALCGCPEKRILKSFLHDGLCLMRGDQIIRTAK